MARPEEMAQNMMNKWVHMRERQAEDEYKSQTLGKQKRPYLASQCEYLHDAEYWRKQILREITAGISKIQNPGLGEHMIRDINDDINKKIREKYHWNKRIKQLGGPDYEKMERKQQLEENIGGGSGSVVIGSGGYKYFGAAKDLPGVKELFIKHAKRSAKRKRTELYNNITPDYYGFRDEEDDVLVELEREAKNQYLARLKEEQEKEKKKDKNNQQTNNTDDDDDDDSESNSSDDDHYGFTLFDNDNDDDMAIPTQELVAQAILDHKKKALLERFSM